MEGSVHHLPCDGCGLEASPKHIAERLRRLELSTRFRPLHTSVLFVALAPSRRPEDDFYGPPESKKFFDPFLGALGSASSTDDPTPGLSTRIADTTRLAEFQRVGYYLAYLSECAIPSHEEPAASTIARLGPTLIRRIRFNYKPNYVAPIGEEMIPCIDVLKGAGMGPALILDHGLPLPMPGTGNRDWRELFHGAVSSVARSDNLSSEYDRIEVTDPKRKLRAGSNL